MEGGSNGEAMPGEAEEDGRKKNRRKAMPGEEEKEDGSGFRRKRSFFFSH